ncbi:MAG TPA: 2-oxoacid:ferredoxin oxidoreductase subunit beta, partial [Bacteroidales bacterium]|nr:2-oxoacid:ferredoxin oxidoreductase subunit beta [Bacteroidales bacterium]
SFAELKHDGTALVEVLQNCVIFNDRTHSIISDRDVRADRTIVLQHGKPMIFGKNKDKGLILDGMRLKAVTIGENGITTDDLLVHNAEEQNHGIHIMLCEMEWPELPVALGIIRRVKDRTYDDMVRDQVTELANKSNIRCMNDMLRSGDTWVVE